MKIFAWFSMYNLFLDLQKVSSFHSITPYEYDTYPPQSTETAWEAKEFWRLVFTNYTAIDDPNNHDGVITHLEPHILECEVKWALGSITKTKLVDVMEFQWSYFISWKMMRWKCCTQYPSTFGKLSSGQSLEKLSFHSNPKERQCQTLLKLSHNCTHLTH